MVAPSSEFLVFESQFHEKSPRYLLSYISSCRLLKLINLTKKQSFKKLSDNFAKLTSSGSSKIMFKNAKNLTLYNCIVVEAPVRFSKTERGQF